MAFMAYGKRVSIGEQSVVYEYGEAIDLGSEGSFVISVADPSDWQVVGADGVPYAAGRVYAKVMKTFRASGEWPAYVGYNA